ncbi:MULTISPECIES: CCA tRNA nucleotidyltransferase [unclassified Brevundimonas]|uniref:CCA tRNA nucleotidyltransferase n=1 Tax=unclassified Brevundimonas TaxID=2622653 RepID=UPI0025B9141B|nr:MULTISPECIES: CCA tRNA nucleotidyltransferase [unclassified Brevundimonas]
MSTPDLGQQTWLSSDSSKAVIAALEAFGGTDCARFVGGCVRNAILGAKVDDIDIATCLTPDQVLAALKKAGIRAVPTGIEHGTVTAIVRGRPFEITTLRRDVETDGRRAVVAFTTDWAEDAARRDFCLNALYASADGAIHDPTGRGLADALARRVVFVGEARQRIREDYLRILRFYRFWAWYGKGPVDPEGHAACSALADGVASLSAERVSKELLKLLGAANPVPAIEAMTEAGVLQVILPQLSSDGFEAVAQLTDDPLLRLAALLPREPEQVVAEAKRLRLSNAQRDRWLAAIKPLPDVLTEQTMRAVVWTDGVQAFCDRSILRQAVEPEAAPYAGLRQMAMAWEPPPMPVSGRDLSRSGIKAGPLTGIILKRFQEEWIAADFPSEGHAERLAAIIHRLRPSDSA